MHLHERGDLRHEDHHWDGEFLAVVGQSQGVVARRCGNHPFLPLLL